MELTKEFLSDIFSQALSYDDYLASASAQQSQRWSDVHQAAKVTDKQEQLLSGFTREMNVLAVSSTACGDCIEQMPLVAKISQVSEKINLRFIDRDANAQLRDTLKINAGNRVPVLVFMAEDFEFCSAYGDRSLTRYRSIADRMLGAACSTGLFIPEDDELAGTLSDWLNEFERIQLMLRLSARLRQKHND